MKTQQHIRHILFIFLALAMFLPATAQDEKEKQKAEQQKQHEQQFIIERKQRAQEHAMQQAQERMKEMQYQYQVGDNGRYFFSPSGTSSSQFSISKTFSGETKKSDGTFEVDESIRYLSLSLSGKVKSGSITIILLLPGGEEYRRLTIDDSADIQFSQNLIISEDEKKYYGNWKYIIDAKNAEGTYRLNLNTR
jgi:ATPase subunit of ABC transporter with duplicated ATPase domains